MARAPCTVAILCVYAVGRPDGVPRGLGRGVRPPRRIPTSLAHLLSSTGGPRAAGAGLIQCTGRWASESGGCEQTDGEDTPFQGLYSESAPSARKGEAHASNASRCSCRMAWRRPGFVRGRGRAPRESPQRLGTRCPASSARPRWSCASPERRGGSRSASTGSIQCTGR